MLNVAKELTAHLLLRIQLHYIVNFCQMFCCLSFHPPPTRLNQMYVDAKRA